MSHADTFRKEAAQCYSIWRGSHTNKLMPARWDDLDEGWKDAFTTVYFLGRLDEKTRADGEKTIVPKET